MSSNDENENNELENMIVEVRVVKQKHDSNVRKTFWKFALKRFAKMLKNKIAKKENLSKAKNIRSRNYLDVVDFVQSMSNNNSIIIVSLLNVLMQDVNTRQIFTSRVAKFQVFKHIKEKQKTRDNQKIRDKSQRMSQIVREMSNAKSVTQSILHIKMKIKFLNLLRLCSKINKTFFRIMNDNEATTIKATTSKTTQSINVSSICNDITKAMHMNDLIVRISSLKAMCVVACSKTFVSIENVKVKTLFDNEVEINCINKRLVDEANLFIRHETIMSMIATTNDNVKFVKVCDDLKVRLREVIIITSIFVILKSNHDLILERFFERVARMSSTNMNDESLKLVMHFDDEFTRVFFLVVSINHSRNRETNIVFVVESLN